MSIETPTKKDILDAQRELEARATSEGYDRFIQHQKQVSDNEGDFATVEGRKFISGAIPLVAKEIENYLQNANKGQGKGRTPVAYGILKDFHPEALAFIALSNAYHAFTRKSSLADAMVQIGNILETEVVAKLLEQERGLKVALRIQKQLQRQGSSKSKIKALKKLSKDNLESVSYWGNDKKVKVAEPLINAVLTALPDIFVVKTVGGAGDMVTIITMTDEAVAYLGSLKDASAWLNPIHRPMVVLPRRWEGMDTGCYYDERAARSVKLVRTYTDEHRDIIRKAISAGQMDYVLSAVNTIQETPWKINTKVLEALKWAYASDTHIEGLPKIKALPLPPRMEPEVWDKMSEVERKGHRLTLSGIHEQNRRMLGERAVLDRDLEIAEDLIDYDRFYLPHNLDFRGRVYPVPHFNHQRADHIKALFKFADGEPLGDGGAFWLAIHLANCGDFEKVSKKSFDDRIQWVQDNEQNILDVAADPIGTVYYWSEADSPFCFLAACFEYAEWVESGRSTSFISHIPVALDGSNSGLQHYSAAMRAEDEASFVSLVPCEKPSDLYQIIADTVRLEVMDDLAHKDPLTAKLAQVALENGITRSLVKRNVMTYAYSSAQFGFRNQIMEDTIRPIDTQVLTGRRESNPYSIEVDGRMDGGFKVANYLAGKIYRTVTSTVAKAEAGMSFFKQVASALAHEGQPLVWQNPLGMPIVHKYAVWDMKVVELYLFGKVKVGDSKQGQSSLGLIKSSIRTKPTSKIDKHKARSAVAPNVIHSMDGAHLLLTVLAAKDEGYSSFALIHDSFGVHAGKTERFFTIIREAFVEMYEAYDPFEEILEAAKAVLSDKGIEKLPEAPEKGQLDLRQIIEADYAFA
jgi:DNA-directed RNA polymerase